MQQATANSLDVVILDLMLPGLSGFEVLKQLRLRQVWTPVLILSAEDGDAEQIKAFDLGADDYLTKPLSFGVLVARLRALIRRGVPVRPGSGPPFSPAGIDRHRSDCTRIRLAGIPDAPPGHRTVQVGHP